MPIDRSELRRLAEAATKGPWIGDEPSNWHGLAGRVCNELHEPIAQVQISGWPKRIGRANLAFIAAANPAAILELLDELDAARGEAVSGG